VVSRIASANKSSSTLTLGFLGALKSPTFDRARLNAWLTAPAVMQKLFSLPPLLPQNKSRLCEY
jgi:hypothetical protein